MEVALIYSATFFLGKSLIIAFDRNTHPIKQEWFTYDSFVYFTQILII
jgi:hypothetical protein